jgi:hypothetical protein
LNLNLQECDFSEMSVVPCRLLQKQSQTCHAGTQTPSAATPRSPRTRARRCPGPISRARRKASACSPIQRARGSRISTPGPRHQTSSCASTAPCATPKPLPQQAVGRAVATNEEADSGAQSTSLSCAQEQISARAGRTGVALRLPTSARRLSTRACALAAQPLLAQPRRVGSTAAFLRRRRVFVSLLQLLHCMSASTSEPAEATPHRSGPDVFVR